jgi:DNA-binding response OmpR family regulator
MHYQGFGVEQKYLEAAKWFRLAADQGDSEAQRFLGCMYAEGKGVSQDFAEALKWCKIAAENPSGYFWLLLYTHMQKANVIPRALVVDNSPEALNRIHTLVKESGMECFTSNNAASALLFLEKDLPDVVIVNTAMPDMDGFELCRQLKANENTQHIPVLLSVVSMDSASCVKGFEAGAQDYLSSTMCLAELQHRIKIAAQRYRRHNALLNQLYLQREIIEYEKQILRLESFRFHNNNLLAVAQGYFMFTTEYGYQSTSEDKELYKSGADCIDRLITNHRCLELIIRRRDSNSDVVDVNQMIDDVIAWMDLSIASIYSYHVFPLISQDIDTVKPPHFAQLMNFKIPIRSSIQPGRKWYGSPADVVWTLLCLIQYLMNMFTDQKDPAVEIRDVVIDGNYILVISNNAARIDDKYRGYLLDPISFNTYPFGTAGLYLAQRFAARLGGLLVIKPSELESGNEFMLWLPSDQPKEIKTEKCY